MNAVTNFLVVVTGAAILVVLLARKAPDMGILQDKIDALTVQSDKVGTEVTAANAEFQDAIAALEAEVAALVANGTVDTTGLEAALARLDAITPDSDVPSEPVSPDSDVPDVLIDINPPVDIPVEG